MFDVTPLHDGGMYRAAVPRTADPEVRAALVDAAARLLAEEGPAAMTTRRVATEAGTTTMAVYTHFGGKEDLVRAIVWEGFERLTAHLSGVRRTADPVADLLHQAAAYRANAHDNPHLYAVMFGGTSVPEYRSSPEDVAHGFWSFLMLVDAVQRCMDAGRFDEGEAFAVASQLWSAAHGVVTLEQQGFLDDGDDVLATMCTTLAIGLGDSPAAAHTSARRAARRRPA